MRGVKKNNFSSFKDAKYNRRGIRLDAVELPKAGEAEAKNKKRQKGKNMTE